jgi:hypothetical protein
MTSPPAAPQAPACSAFIRSPTLETLLREVDKLAGVKALQLPPGLFADCSERLVEAWRARASRSYPSDLAAAAAPMRLTLLAALCWSQSAEITDALIDLLPGLVHKINARAERRVEKELTEDLRRVRGKEGILFRLAQAAVDHPDDTVRDAIWRLLTRFLPTARHPITTLPPGTASGVPGLAGKRQGADVVDRCR